MTSPRILYHLLDNDSYVSVSVLARLTGRSRRTVFRELEHIDAALDEWGLTLETKAGKGLRIQCDESKRTQLLARFKNICEKKRSRRERLVSLLAELLMNSGEIHKLSYYAVALSVSEATVSEDFDVLENYLSQFSILLIRRPGLGVYAAGSEENIRAALTMRVFQDGSINDTFFLDNTGFPTRPAARFAEELLAQHYSKLEWMTEESLGLLGVSIAVAIERIIDGHFVSSANSAQNAFTVQMRCASEITRAVEIMYSITLPAAETAYIAGLIAQGRAKAQSPLGAANDAEYEYIEKLCIIMINAYDQNLSVLLRHNADLRVGLRAHLPPAISRIKNRVILPDPFEGNLSVHYGDVYQKVKQAVNALETELGLPVNESETSFFALHFYAAELAMNEKNVRKRRVKAGVVCTAGIGASQLIASQLRTHFKGEVEITVSSWDDRQKLETMDFLVSTMPLAGTDKPVVITGAILSDNDYRSLRELISESSFTDIKHISYNTAQNSLYERINTMRYGLALLQSLLNSFDVYYVDRDIRFDTLVKFCAERFTGTSGDAGMLFDKLSLREKTATQVLPELGIVLLHTRSNAVKTPVFAVIKPTDGGFLDRYFGGVTSCALMLLPENAPPQIAALMGNLSASLIETPAFLDAVREGSKEIIRAVLEAEINELVWQDEALC
ncbi:MAG: transcription antiterminator [Spirochaetaceae bacterium]|jgi:mannitol operon transcriptional antiterminator|nr:transcription antiterminator [Spirochaetaceae bacterium]